MWPILSRDPSHSMTGVQHRVTLDKLWKDRSNQKFERWTFLGGISEKFLVELEDSRKMVRRQKLYISL